MTMGWVGRFAKSSIGAKIVMATTGLMLVGFVLAHMAGNLQIFVGQDQYNAYAHFLKDDIPELLWPLRLGLLGAVLAHLGSGLRLAALNRAARPTNYHERRYRRASLFSRGMAYSGLVVVAFLIYHLAHFTFGYTDPEHYGLIDSAGRRDAYSMFVYGFQSVPVTISYVVAMVLLGMHLSHGVGSMLQTLGLNHPRINPALAKVGPALAILVVVGNCAMPLAVLLGIIQLPGAGA